MSAKVEKNLLDGLSGEFNPDFNLIMNKFFVALFISLIGMAMGFAITPKIPGLFWAAVVAEFVMVIASIFVRTKKIGYSLTYTFAFVSGYTIGPAIAFYAIKNGVIPVAAVIGGVTLAFGIVAFYGYTTKKNFSFLSTYLFMSLLLLLAFNVAGLFIPALWIGLKSRLIASFGILVFTGYTLLDMNYYAKNIRSEDELPNIVLNLYLDYINLLLDVLRLFFSKK